MDNIQELLIAILPSLTAIGGVLFTAMKMFSRFKELIKKVDDKTDLADAKSEMESLIAENRELRRQVADIITEVRKIKYEYDDKQI